MDPLYLHAERQVPNWNVKPLSCDPITVWESGGEVTVIPSGLRTRFINSCWPRRAGTSSPCSGRSSWRGPFAFETMDAQVTAWAAQIAAAVDEDPTLNLQAWESQVEYLHGVLQQDVEDFRAHLEEGYVVEK
jgi:hypothetical protein